MIREGAASQPVLPVMRGPDEPTVGILGRAWRRRGVPREGTEARLAFLDEGSRHCPRPLETDVHVAGQDQLHVGLLGAADPLPVSVLGIAPPAEMAAIVEDRLAVERELHLAIHTADH